MLITLNFEILLILIVITEIIFGIKNLFEIVYSGYLRNLCVLVFGSMLIHHFGDIRFSSFLVSIEIAITVYTIIA
jgi:hypothetical protein